MTFALATAPLALAQPATVGGEPDDAGGEAEFVAAETVSAAASFGGQFGFALPIYLAAGVDLYAGLAATVRRFVDDAVATYGSVYRDLRYRAPIVGRRVEGDSATLTVDYAGSVVEIVMGQVVEASGEAEADFRWDRCRWRRTGLRY